MLVLDQKKTMPPRMRGAVLISSLCAAGLAAADQVGIDASGAQAEFNVGVGTTEQVGSWLDEIGFGELKKTFAKNVVDGAALREITEEELKELGVKKVGCVRCAPRARAVAPSALAHSSAPEWPQPRPFCRRRTRALTRAPSRHPPFRSPPQPAQALRADPVRGLARLRAAGPHGAGRRAERERDEQRAGGRVVGAGGLWRRQKGLWRKRRRRPGAARPQRGTRRRARDIPARGGVDFSRRAALHGLTRAVSAPSRAPVPHPAAAGRAQGRAQREQARPAAALRARALHGDARLPQPGARGRRGVVGRAGGQQLARDGEAPRRAASRPRRAARLKPLYPPAPTPRSGWASTCARSSSTRWTVSRCPTSRRTSYAPSWA